MSKFCLRSWRSRSVLDRLGSKHPEMGEEQCLDIDVE